MANINFLENEVIEFKKTTGENRRLLDKVIPSGWKDTEYPEIKMGK